MVVVLLVIIISEGCSCNMEVGIFLVIGFCRIFFSVCVLFVLLIIISKFFVVMMFFGFIVM